MNLHVEFTTSKRPSSYRLVALTLERLVPCLLAALIVFGEYHVFLL